MPSLLYFVTEDWFFCSHFLPMARAARQTGLDVTVATRVRAHRRAIEAEGFRVIPIEAERGSLSPLQIATSLLAMMRTLRRHRPDIVHCVALRNVVLGGLVVRLAVGSSALILAPTGLGALWVRDRLRDRVARWVTRQAVRYLVGRGAWLLFENKDDPAVFGLSLNHPRVRLVPGAGVDSSEFTPAEEPPAPPLRVAVVSRMLRAKGIEEAVAAISLARQGQREIELHLFGEPDSSNRDSLSVEEMKRLAERPGIHWHGKVADVAQVWTRHHVALLLSRREGLPRSLVEAAASGRPLVAADVPGCREVVLPGRSGFLVEWNNPHQAAAALAELHDDPSVRRRMGEAARAHFLERFTAERVMAIMAGLYGQLTSDG